MQQSATSNGRTPSQNYAQLNPYLSQQLPPIEHQQAIQQPASSAENESYGVERNVQQNNYRIDDNMPPQLLERNEHNGPSLDQPQANQWNGANNGNVANQLLFNAQVPAGQMPPATTPMQFQQQALALLLSARGGQDFAANHFQANVNQGQVPMQGQFPPMPENWPSGGPRNDLWQAGMNQGQAVAQNLVQQDGRPKPWTPQFSPSDLWNTRANSLAQLQHQYQQILAMQQGAPPSRLVDGQIQGPMLDPLYAAAHGQLPQNRGPLPPNLNLMCPENAPPYVGMQRVSLPMPHVMQPPNTCRSMIISTPHDSEALSELQCFLREQIEYFSAGEEDVSSHTRGRNKNISPRQVGIRCIHCKLLPVTARGPGAVYFPSSIDGIYQAGQNLHIYHIKKGCPTFSEELKEWYKQVAARKSYVGRGREYWTESARAVGLVNTPNGIRFSEDKDLDSKSTSFNSRSNGNGHASSPYASSPSYTPSITGSVLSPSITAGGDLVRPEDKNIATDYIFVLMSQLRPCLLSPSDRVGYRNGLSLGMPGLECKHCGGDRGGYGAGRFFRSSPSSQSKNENISQIYKHVMDCIACSSEIKVALESTKQQHAEQSESLKRGWKKIFFEKISARLNEHCKGLEKEKPKSENR
mmetsp:Transcript_6242/g.7136  ORF Transcript_6242/g.7136 Transcript_6242/m.7136 type:complete len:638 (+) Transcript_6242:92-2005(+)